MDANVREPGARPTSSQALVADEATSLLGDMKQQVSGLGRYRGLERSSVDRLEWHSDGIGVEVENLLRQSEDGHIQDEAASTGADEEENSPYPEVRASVPNYDEDVPCNTIRAWTIGITFVFLAAGINTVFSLRSPAIYISSLVAQVIAFPIGRAWSAIMPRRQFNTFGMQWSLNPGPFNQKEHAIIVVMSSVSVSVAYTTDILLSQISFYKQDFGLVFQILLTLSSQSLGYGVAGVLRKYLVYPASMIWPENLVCVTLMNTLHEKKDVRDPTVLGGNMSRYRWFTIVSLCSFFWYFFPGWLCQCLSVFSFVTWIYPQNPVINQIFGGFTGISLLPITFDWTQVAGYIGSPLIPPWQAIGNTLLSVFIFYVFGALILQYTGSFYGAYLPMSDANTFDNTGKPYDVNRVVTADFRLNETAYAEYSPVFISSTFTLFYGLAFATITSLVVYVYLEHGEEIWRQFKDSKDERPDIHMKLMRKYKEAPTWWYQVMFAIMFVIGFYTVLAYPTHLSWWAFLLSVSIAFGFSLPIGIIQAVTTNQISLDVLTEFVYGYLQPGRPLALMIFKTYGQITMSQTLSFVSDLKFGHYMKVPPRTMFMCQVVANTCACVIQVLVLNFSLNNIDNICDMRQREHFTCPGGRVYYSASVIWGLIGPARVFSVGQLYSTLLIFFPIGLVTPILIHRLAKRYPKLPFKFLMAPLLFGGAAYIPPATVLNYASWAIVGFVFQYWIKKRHFRWWSRLSFLTSCGLDLGLGLATLFIFFAFVLRGVNPPNWWGNNIVSSTMDFQGTAIRKHVKEGETFGPSTW